MISIQTNKNDMVYVDFENRPWETINSDQYFGPKYKKFLVDTNGVKFADVKSTIFNDCGFELKFDENSNFFTMKPNIKLKWTGKQNFEPKFATMQLVVNNNGKNSYPTLKQNFEIDYSYSGTGKQYIIKIPEFKLKELQKIKDLDSLIIRWKVYGEILNPIYDDSSIPTYNGMKLLLSKDQGLGLKDYDSNKRREFSFNENESIITFKFAKGFNLKNEEMTLLTNEVDFKNLYWDFNQHYYDLNIDISNKLEINQNNIDILSLANLPIDEKYGRIMSLKGQYIEEKVKLMDYTYFDQSSMTVKNDDKNIGLLGYTLPINFKGSFVPILTLNLYGYNGFKIRYFQNFEKPYFDVLDGILKLQIKTRNNDDALPKDLMWLSVSSEDISKISSSSTQSENLIHEIIKELEEIYQEYKEK